MEPELRDAIVDAALALAAERSWEAVRLHEVAARLGVPVAALHGQFREKEDIVDAWFDRADAALLAEAGRAGFAALGARDRLERPLMAWFGALAAHRRATREMILGKLEPGHLHYQLAGLLRVSRTVQWWREAAGRDAVLPWRALEETGLTSIYLAVFARFLWDDSPDHVATRALLTRLLDDAGKLAQHIGPIFGYRGPGTAAH